MRTLALKNARLRAEIVPEIGAALSRLDWIAGGDALPVLRPFLAEGAQEGLPPRPNQLACFPFVPWANRMAGGFAFEGRSYAIAPNREGDPYPMHGEGWLLPWEVAEQSDTRAVLVLDRTAGAPFSYRTQITYALNDSALRITLDVLNAGEVVLPFGLGLHPWLPRSGGVTLQARASQVWMSGMDKLPTQAVAVPDEWSFVHANTLPEGQIDNVFAGWDGRAEIRWPETGLSLQLESDCGYYIVYAPPGKDFFCFEPVDHRIDAHNGRGGPERHGLTLLQPGQSLTRHFRFEITQS